MFGFFFKKNVCDLWDNLFYTVICNFFSLIALFASFLMFTAALNAPLAGTLKIAAVLASLAAGCTLVCTVGIALGDNAARIAQFNSARYGNFFRRIAASLRDGALCGIFIAAVISIAAISMPFYYRMWNSSRNPLWFVFMVIIFWFVITTAFALQWLLPVRSLLHNGFKKSLKKSYIIFFDNLGFSFAVTLVNILNTLISVITFGLYPGTAGIVLTNTNALRILLYKYDWLEVNPGLPPKERKNVPWNELLAKDKKTLGPRTLKGFFFPWKEK